MGGEGAGEVREIDHCSGSGQQGASKRCKKAKKGLRVRQPRISDKSWHKSRSLSIWLRSRKSRREITAVTFDVLKMRASQMARDPSEVGDEHAVEPVQHKDVVKHES